MRMLFIQNEDKITMSGEKHFQPNFKPELFRYAKTNNYICHFFIAKASFNEGRLSDLEVNITGLKIYDMIFSMYRASG